jgi:hypothetical protein
MVIERQAKESPYVALIVALTHLRYSGNRNVGRKIELRGQLFYLRRRYRATVRQEPPHLNEQARFRCA